MGSMSLVHWLIVLGVVLLIFGTKKLRNVGSDLGGAIKDFKDGMRGGGTDAHGKVDDAAKRVASGETIDVHAKEKS